MQDVDTSDKKHLKIFQQAVKAGVWVFALRIVIQSLSYVRFIILANLLSNELLGIMGAGMLALQTVSTFSATGFQAALIQKGTDIRRYLDTAWTVGLIRAGLVFAVICLIAPLAAMLKVPEGQLGLTISVIRVTGLTIILSSLCNIGTVYYSKELNFNKIFFLQSIASLAGISVSITVAYIYRSVWALVIGKLTEGAVRAIVSYFMHPYRPKLNFHIGKAKELWGFGKWIFVGSILGFLITCGDDYFVWGYLGFASLGLYQYAYRFAMMPVGEITSVISQVTFPAYSKLQDDLPRLKDAYLQVLKMTAFLSVPAAFLLAILANDLVVLFLKDRHLPMIPVIQVLAIRGMICSIGATRGPLFQSIAKHNRGVVLKSIKLAIIVVLIYPFTKRWGIVGTAWVISIADAMVQPLAVYFVADVIKCRVWEVLKPVVYPLIASTIMTTTVITVRLFVFEDITFVLFFVLAIIGAITYLTAVYLLDRFCGYGIRTNITAQLGVLKKKQSRLVNEFDKYYCCKCCQRKVGLSYRA